MPSSIKRQKQPKIIISSMIMKGFYTTNVCPVGTFAQVDNVTDNTT